MTRKLGSLALVAAFAAALLVATVAAARTSSPLPLGEGPGVRVITYQGRLADAAGTPLTGAVTLTVRLYSQPISGTQAWSETHTDVHLLEGIFVIALGKTNPLQPEHVASPRWIEISVDDGPPLLPRQPLGAAPYALLAGQALSATYASTAASAASAVAAEAAIDAIWSITSAYALSAANAGHVPWPGIVGVPADLLDGDQAGAPLSHTHDERYYTEAEVDTLLATKSDVGHTHTWTVTEVLTATWSTTSTWAYGAPWSGLAGVPAELLDGDQVGASLTHTHDERYYTQVQVDARLATKLNAGDAYTVGQAYTQAEIDAALAIKADAAHLHDTRYYTQTHVDELLAAKAPASHTHAAGEIVTGTLADERIAQALARDVEVPGLVAAAGYITKTLADTLYAPAGHNHAGAYASASHTHAGSDITSPVSEAITATWSTSSSFATFASTSTFASFASASTWAAGSPWAGLSDVPAGLADGIDDTDDNVSWAEISTLVGTGSSQVAAGNHTHDGRYYTEAEIDAALAAKIDAGSVYTVGQTYTQAETDARLATKSDAGHVHDGRYYTQTLVDTLLATKADASHTHAGSDITSPVDQAISATWSTTATWASSSPWAGLTDVPGDLADGDDDALRDLSCANGQLAKWNGSTWACGDDSSVTYTPGFGLGLAGTQFAVVTATIQQRVDGNCALGSTFQAVHADGSVDCQPDAPLRRVAAPAATVSTTLDASGDAGWYGSVTVGTDGLPVISYQDNAALTLKVAHCEDLACTAATVTTVDSTCGGAKWSSIAVGTDGLPVISYYADNFGSLRVAHCEGLACTSATITDVDGVPVSGDVAGYYSSITIGADGLPVVSHYDTTNTALKVSHCNDLACASATNTTVDDTGDVGRWSAISVGADGLPVISYYDATTANKNLKVAHCSDLACTAAISTTLDAAGDVGWYTSIAIGADSLPIVSYMDFTNRDLKVAHCNDLACTSAITVTLVTDDDTGRYSSITVRADGLPLISFYDYTAKALKLAHCASTACMAATLTTLDASSDDVGMYTALTIGADSLPLVIYYDTAGTSLKALHCANALCASYFRRR